MNKRFAGFPDRTAYVPVPAPFFGHLLVEMDDLGELKLTLHLWRRLGEKRGFPRFVRRGELLGDRLLLRSLRTTGATDLVGELDRCLQRAVERGIFLAVSVSQNGRDDTCYLLNTPSNQRAIERVLAGELSLGPFVPAAPASVREGPRQRPSIYELYEQNIGLLTPMLAEELAEAEATYPPEWIEEAFREALAYNRRSWRYVQRILQNWADRGRGPHGETGGRPKPPDDPTSYISGRYGHLIKR